MTDRLVRLSELTKITGLSPSTIWRQEKAGKFPRRRNISSRAVAWSESEVEAWITALCSETTNTETEELNNG